MKKKGVRTEAKSPRELNPSTLLIQEKKTFFVFLKVKLLQSGASLLGLAKSTYSRSSKLIALAQLQSS